MLNLYSVRLTKTRGRDGEKNQCHLKKNFLLFVIICIQNLFICSTYLLYPFKCIIRPSTIAFGALQSHTLNEKTDSILYSLKNSYKKISFFLFFVSSLCFFFSYSDWFIWSKISFGLAILFDRCFICFVVGWLKRLLNLNINHK